MSDTIDVWHLNPELVYMFDQDRVVGGLMKQLNVPNLFARASEFNAMKALVAFDNHPTHWIILRLWQGVPAYSPNHSIHKFVRNPEPNGSLFEAVPKATTSRTKMEIKLTEECRAMEAASPFAFQQLPDR